jgi:hypothetical protein
MLSLRSLSSATRCVKNEEMAKTGNRRANRQTATAAQSANPCGDATRSFSVFLANLVLTRFLDIIMVLPS